MSAPEPRRVLIATTLMTTASGTVTYTRDLAISLLRHGWLPIVYLERHHDHSEIRRYYRAADFCMVTSLHDGMNLVAKEYVAAQPDDDGSLILSRFTGASRELRDAWLVNPYDVEDVSAAIHDALASDPDERRSRMRRLRAHVREYNIYGWAGMLAAELARIPQPSLQRG